MKFLIVVFLIPLLAIPAFAQTNSQILPTEKGTLDVKLSYDEIIPGQQTNLSVDFINPQTKKIQEHIDYKMTVSKDNEAVFGPIPLTHTSGGSVKIPVPFDDEGIYSVELEIEGILFQPIPVEKVSFDVAVGESVVQPASIPENNDGGCLIATAAFGSELSPQIQQLRELRLMGMVPLEHEYKVMGLAPYGPAGGARDSLALSFHNLIEWDRARPMTWRRPAGVPIGNGILPFLDRLIARHRFDDHVAAAVQAFTEDFLAAWVSRCVKETGIGTVCLSGGIFMNVKANQRILAAPGVERLFIVPSGGDESNACGAAIAAFAQHPQDQGRPVAIPGLASLYWGGEFSPADTEKAVRNFRFASKVAV